jgi:hypothetical protein
VGVLCFSLHSPEMGTRRELVPLQNRTEQAPFFHVLNPPPLCLAHIYFTFATPSRYVGAPSCAGPRGGVGEGEAWGEEPRLPSMWCWKRCGARPSLSGLCPHAQRLRRAQCADHMSLVLPYRVAHKGTPLLLSPPLVATASKPIAAVGCTCAPTLLRSSGL